MGPQTGESLAGSLAPMATGPQDAAPGDRLDHFAFDGGGSDGVCEEDALAGGRPVRLGALPPARHRAKEAPPPRGCAEARAATLRAAPDDDPFRFDAEEGQDPGLEERTDGHCAGAGEEGDAECRELVTSDGVEDALGARQKKELIRSCLVSSVNVLMNLTNENPEGCRQVATPKGLHTVASLVVSRAPRSCHHPPSDSRLAFKEAEPRSDGGPVQRAPPPSEGAAAAEQAQEGSGSPGVGSPVDEDVDLLVVVLGVLVNLVEKDNLNRQRLASLVCTVPGGRSGGPDANGAQGGGGGGSAVAVLPSLCSLFLSKRGSAEAAIASDEAGAVELDGDDARVEQGQREAENMMVEAYAALLLAFLCRHSEDARAQVGALLPGGLSALVPVLEHFMAFHRSLNTIKPESQTAVQDLIDACKQAS